MTSKTITTQYESRDNLLYLVGDRNFTPLQGRDACLDLYVLMFYERGTDKYSRVKTTCARNATGLQTDPVLWDYEDCLSDNLVSYQLEQST